MTQRSKAGYKTFKNSEFATNGTGAITATKVRDVHEDMADSTLFIIDHLLDEDNMASDSATQVPSQQSVKAYVDNYASRTTKISLSSAEILALFTTPKQLVAAPGAGKMVNLHNIKFVYTFVSAAYATNTTLQVLYGSTSASSIVSQSNIISGTNSLTAFIGATNAAVTICNTPVSSFTNTALNLTVVTGNPTGGDSTMDVYVTYSIINL